MGSQTSKDAFLREEIGCDSLGTVPCNSTHHMTCLEGVCALFIAETEKHCVPQCRCYIGYFGATCEFRDSSLVATAGIVGGVICVFVLLAITFAAWCCCKTRRKRREFAASQASSRPYDATQPLSTTSLFSTDLPQQVQRLHEDFPPISRPRSGYYEHELIGDSFSGIGSNPAYPSHGPQETEQLLHFDLTDGLHLPNQPRPAIGFSYQDQSPNAHVTLNNESLIRC